MAGQMDFRLDEPAWAALDRERPGKPFMVRAGGRVLQFRPAPDVPAGLLVQVAADWRLFFGYLVVNRDELAGVDFAWWKAEHMLRLYRRHHGLCLLPEQDQRLFQLMEKEEYREAIEADLHEVYGVDLGRLWRERQWRKLLGLIERLRRATHFGEVVAADEVLAEFMLRKRDKDDQDALPERRMAEFTVEAELLTIVADRLAELVQVSVGTRGGRGRSVKPLPRPKTAIATLRTKREQQHVQFTLDRVFGLVDAKGRSTGTGA